MKNIFLIAAFLSAACASAQVAIGKTDLSNVSVSLEFGSGNKGIIVPWVTSAAAVTNAQLGTIVFDTADKLMKYRKNDGTWFALSKNETATVGGNAGFDTTGAADTSLQDALTDKPDAKASIGTPTSTPGMLVLEDSNKAMILPKVASPHLNIVNPEPGMMVYDTTAKQLAVFNGTVWNFWKP